MAGNISKNKDECDLIEMVNKLQNKLAASGKILDISLPQIIVVGCQSAGKSSVLESIIGREFLPRGTGTVTRRPTVIQLQPNDEVYAVFLHLRDRKFTDFEAVKQEIIDETLRDPGPSGFSNKPIILKIYAPKVLKLSFVDMPGIIQNATGNQTEEAIQDVKNMILKYIEQPNSLILAVSPANNDIATSDALAIAKQVDLKRERTLGVLTKLDLMDVGTHALDVLENRTLYLQRGYVGVLNRNQQDNDEEKSIEYSLAKEKRFFENHPAYSRISDVMGSPHLQKVLHIQLREHIKKILPKLRKELTQKLNSVRRELREFEAIMDLNSGNTNAVQAYLFKLVQNFIDDTHTKIFGNSEHVSMSKLTIGAVINYKIYTDLQKILKMPTSLTDDELMTLIANQHGTRNTLSIPSISLEAACGSILKLYIEPLEGFVDSITDLLISDIEDSAESISAYPNLKAELVRFIHESIDKATIETKELLKKHIKAEMNYCNIYHWDFNNSKFSFQGCRQDFQSPIRPLSGPFSIDTKKKKKKKTKCPNFEIKQFNGGLQCTPVKIWKSHEETEADGNNASGENNAGDEDDLSTSADYISNQLKENRNAKENSRNLAEIVKEYMQLMQKQIGDATIKYIMCFLVKGVSEFIRSSLMLKLMGSDNLKTLMEECEKDFLMRDNMLTTCMDLEEALNAIQSF